MLLSSNPLFTGKKTQHTAEEEMLIALFADTPTLSDAMEEEFFS